MATLIVVGLGLLTGLIILLTWLSSRGKFMFLDNVVNDRALVKKPWHEYVSIAKSLFMWRLGFGMVTVLIFGSYLLYIYNEIFVMYYSNTTHYDDLDILFAALRMGIFFIILAIIFACIWMFLNDFVVPLMYKNNTSVWIGWSHFMPLLQQHFVYFILYGLFILVLLVLFAILLGIFGLITCCIGFLLLAIPYIGSVILLPVSVTYRALSLEFLAQFGEAFKIFPETDAAQKVAE